MSAKKMRQRARMLPLARFRDKTAALGPYDVLQLVWGDLPAIAEAVGRDTSTVQRAIAGGPHVRASAALIDGIEAVVGLPIGRIRPMGVRSGPRREPSTKDAA